MVRFSAKRLAAGAVAPPIAVGVLAGLVALVAAPGELGFVLAAGLIVAVPALLMAGVAAVSPEMPASRAPMVVIQASAMRTLMSLALAVVIHVTGEPERLVFWGVFLTAAVVALAGETIAACRAVARPTVPDPGGSNAEEPTG